MPNLTLVSNLFLLLSLGMALVVIGLLFRYLEGRARITAIVLFSLWLLYAGVLGYSGAVARKVPPGPLFFLVPQLLFSGFLIAHPGVRAFALRVPAALLIGLQTFRLLVEILLYGLYQNGLIPRMLTFEGANFDILVGISAPIIAALYARRAISPVAVRWWNVVGILLLANVVVRATLTFSGVLATEVPNVGIGIFPFTFLPGFLAPLALWLHILSLRSLSSLKRGGSS